LVWAEFPETEGMRDLAKKKFLRLVAKSFRTYKSYLVRKYVVTGLAPFAREKHIKPKQWADFVRLKTTAEFKEQSLYFKALRERNIYDHHLGTCGYEGKIEQWEAEDERLAREGISNPWTEYPDDRSRCFLRARSTLSVSGGKAEIIWIGGGTKEVAEKVKQKFTYSQSHEVKYVRENDILSECLGPEHTGRVRGISSYKGWKHGFPESIDMYKKRKRAAVDYDALKAAIRVEIMDELKKIGLLQGGQTEPGYIPSTGGARNPSAPDRPGPVIMDNTVDPIALVDEATPCALLIHFGGTQFEVARGQLYPPGDVHDLQILPGYAVVKVEYVHYPFRCHFLDPPPNVEMTTLGQALMRRILWRRTNILLNPEPMDSSAGHNSIRPQLEPSHHVAMNLATSGADVSNGIGTEEVSMSNCGDEQQNVQNLGGACKRSNSNATENKMTFVEPELDMHMQKNVNKVLKSKVGVHLDKQNKGKTHMLRAHRNVVSKYAKVGQGGSSAWTKANPNFKCGEAMLKENELGSCGPSTLALHAYYLEACAQHKVDIMIDFDPSQFWHTEKSANDLVVGFNDLYDLFNLDALDMGLLRCFSLCMVQKVKDDGLPVGIMDPQMFLKSYIRANESSVLDYVKGVLNHFAKFSNSLIMFPHNTGDHWLLVVIIPKWNKVLYLDSDRSKQRDHGLLKSVINKAFGLSNYKKKAANKGALSHATKFACHRQPNDNTCGFYTAHHMTLAMAASTCEDPSV
ncbi:hypothetical protein BDA96_08G057800, partial [Sorghum bicolor]